MPLTLPQIAANRATVTFDYAGETVHLDFAPSLVTETTIAHAIELQDAVERGVSGANPGEMTEAEGRQTIRAFTDTMADINAFLCHTILKWDLFEDAEMTEMIPLTPDRISQLPIEFRAKAFRALQTGWRLGETKGTRSSRRSHASSSTAIVAGSNH